MLRQEHAGSSFMGKQAVGPIFGTPADSPGEGTGPEDAGDAPLDDAARGEREYVRRRLREELQREPTEGELDEWLRQHTEGY